MKKFSLTFLAAGALFWGLAGCSSSSTETTTTEATAETVMSNDPASATRAGETGVANEFNKEAAENAATLDTTSFPVIAASSDLFETLSSEMAQTRSEHAEVKKFAQQMLSEHGSTITELKSLAAKKNIVLPASPIPMHQRMLSELNEATAGKKFDERYMEAQVKVHQDAVTVFENASKNEQDPDLKAFASASLPAMRMHLEMAKKTKDLVD